MAKCKQCQRDIERGKAYHGEKYKSYPFCSEECYKAFVENKSKPKQVDSSKRKLTDYINELWNGQVNWPFICKQIKNLCEDYGLDYKQLYMVLKYAVVYEDYVVDPQFGLLQFVKFIQPSQEFANQILKNRESAEDLPDEEIVYVKPHKQRVWLKEEDWD